MIERRYRLRKGNRIVGYSRISTGSFFYSKDGFWWNGGKIDHDIADMWTGIKDKNDRFIYVHDIIRIKYSNPLRKSEDFRIQPVGEDWRFSRISDGSLEEKKWLNRVKSFEWISYTFINMELIFGVDES